MYLKFKTSKESADDDSMSYQTLVRFPWEIWAKTCVARQRIRSQHNRAMFSWVIDDSIHFPGSFFLGGGIFCCHSSQSWGATYIRFGEEIGQSLSLSAWVSDFRYFASLRRYSASNSKFRTNYALFEPPVTMGKGWTLVQSTLRAIFRPMLQETI